MEAIAFTARKFADPFLLIRSPEIEASAIGARGCFVFAYRDDVLAVGDLLPHCFAVIERIAALIDVGKLYRFADAQFSLVRFFLSHDHAEQGGLAGPVGGGGAG